MPEGANTNCLLATIHVVRSIGQLTKTLRSPTVSAATLEIFERHFNACLATFPIHLHLKSDIVLDPSCLSPIIYLQNARFILHRHNLSPYCSVEVRIPALNQLLSIAQDTARVLSRCMSSSSMAATTAYGGVHHDWKMALASSASTMLCTHIWRCLLILIFRENFAAALVCVQACKAIGDHHVAMTSCGRYVAFFLRLLLDRLQRNDLGPLEQDEEMVAYVSGDTQSTALGSWIWQGSETGNQLENVPPRSSPYASSGSVGAGRASNEIEWEGWDWIERTLQYLAGELRQKSYERRDVMPVRATMPALHKTEELNNTPKHITTNSRMTIANII